MYVVLFLFAISILYIPYAMKMIKKKREEQDAYAGANPTAAKVYTKVGLGDLFSSESVVVSAVDGAPPVSFFDGIREGQGFFALPGKHVIEVEYSRTRPGVLHKTVTTSTGTTRQEIETEPGRRYRLGFRRDEKRFVLEEL